MITTEIRHFSYVLYLLPFLQTVCLCDSLQTNGRGEVYSWNFLMPPNLFLSSLLPVTAGQKVPTMLYSHTRQLGGDGHAMWFQANPQGPLCSSRPASGWPLPPTRGDTAIPALGEFIPETSASQHGLHIRIIWGNLKLPVPSTFCTPINSVSGAGSWHQCV